MKISQPPGFKKFPPNMQLGRLESTWKGKDIKITMMAQTITFEIRMCMVALVHISYITLKADVVGGEPI